MHSPRTHVRYWSMLFPAMALPGALYMLYFVGDLSGELTQIFYGASKIMLFGLPLLGVLVLEMHPVHRIQIPPLPGAKHWVSAGIGLALGFAIYGMMALLMATPLASFVMDGAPVVQEKLGKLGVVEHFFLFACAISVLHSALEEYYWRWYVFKRLRWSMSGIAPHIIAAVAFSLHHFVLTWIYFTPALALFLGAAVGVGGFLWSMLYEKTGSLLGPWLSHIIVDFAIFWVGYQMLTV